MTTPLAKVLADVPLSARDWSRLIRFLAAQYVRTPGYYFHNLHRWNNKLTETLNATCQEVAKSLRSHSATPLPPARKPSSIIHKAPFDISSFVVVGVEMIVPPGQETGSLKLSTVVGRNTWIASMLSILQGDAIALLQSYRWTILRPSEGYSWFASDHPVVVMILTHEDKISFSAGVGHIGTQIFLPLDPYHLMYTEVGGNIPVRSSRLGPEDTRAIRAIMAKHAFRVIFSSYEDPEIPKLRPRVVDAGQFSFERVGWQQWHTAQVIAEEELRRRSASN